MPQPSEQPRWADGGSASVVDPSSGKKDIGWVAAEKPAASYFNWWMNLVYQWTTYLAGLAGEAFTWTAAHIFSNTVTTNGTLTANGAATFGGALVCNSTATFNGAATFASGGSVALNNGATVATGKALTFSGTAKISIASSPAATAAINNEIHSTSAAKAWARIDHDHIAGASLKDGLNMNGAVSVNPATSEFTVAFAQALTSTFYAVAWGSEISHTLGGNVIFRGVVISKSTSGFVFKILKETVGGASAWVDVTTTDCHVDFTVFGRQ